VDDRDHDQRAFALLKMDMATKQTNELQRAPVTRSFEQYPWNRITLSLMKKVALLGFRETLYNYGDAKEKIVTL